MVNSKAELGGSITWPLTYHLALPEALQKIFSRGLDSNAALWAAAVTANGGTYSAQTLESVSTFCKAAKANGYWSKLNRINLFCGNQLAAALVPLKVGNGSTVDTNVNFVSGDYTESTGLDSDGTKYLRTGLLASALTLNDTHVAVYNRESNASGGACCLGASDGTNTARLELFAPYQDSGVYSFHYDNASGSIQNIAIAGSFGHIAASRTAANSHKIYRNGSVIASNATSGGALPAYEFYVFAKSNGVGAVTFITSHKLSAYSIGSGLTDAEMTHYNTDMQAFQTALGRQV
jgi:hypothetical protein